MRPPPLALRRILLPVWVALEVATLALMVPAAVVGLLMGLADRRLRVARLAAMGICYLSLELSALICLLVVWLARPVTGRRRFDEANLAVTAWVLGAVLAAARATVGLEVDVEEPERLGPLDGREAVIVLARHGGIGDSFALVSILASRYGRRPRVVLKDVLLWEPMIDVALGRLGACFLPSPSRRTAPLEGRVAELAGSLADGDAMLLFPEGGNWTPRRRASALRHLLLSRKTRELRAAALMDHVLPPRPGGVLACLDARPDLPVVVVAHAGLDKLTNASEVWRALPFGPPMRVRWWPAAHPPYGEADRMVWLTTEWAVLDQWVDAVHDPGPPATG